MLIKSVNAIYTGGNIWLFVGEVDDCYFLTDDYGNTLFLDLSPENDLDTALEIEWQEKHTIKELQGQERIAFCDNLAEYIKSRMKGGHFQGMTLNEIEAYKEYWRIEY